ncbi:MAG TPA: cytochrome c oxidase accessory protein CcoG [Phycisphaerales bacterium]
MSVEVNANTVSPAAQPGQPPSVLSTLNADGSRRWLLPKPSIGRFFHRRRVVAYLLILIFTAIPYISINGKPLILLDLSTRHFHIFGQTFLPTDTLMLALLVLSVFLTIFLLTALFGRVWCGWACPQTVYLEFVYRPIERLFEGTPGRARKGWFVGSPLARGLKYLTYLVISCYLAHTFLAYFVGVEQLRVWITRSPAEHPVSFGIMAGVTALMMFDFTFFREQTCLVACPYGRFQSVLLDRNSLIVSYDRGRGEPRGKRAKAAAGIPLPVLGDCIDCRMCVATCPTGIDIRNGLQMECVHCTQCIDACDSVMDKIGKPLGLIRYSSQAALAGENKSGVRPRLVLYPALLTVVLSGLIYLLTHQSPLNVTILRTRGGLFSMNDAGDMVGNQVKVKVVNRTDAPAPITIAAAGVAGARVKLDESDDVVLQPGEMRTVPVLVEAPIDAFEQGKCDISIVVRGVNDFSKSTPYRLVGPGTNPRTQKQHDKQNDTHDDKSHDTHEDKPSKKHDAEEHK